MSVFFFGLFVPITHSHLHLLTKKLGDHFDHITWQQPWANVRFLTIVHTLESLLFMQTNWLDGRMSVYSVKYSWTPLLLSPSLLLILPSRTVRGPEADSSVVSSSPAPWAAWMWKTSLHLLLKVGLLLTPPLWAVCSKLTPSVCLVCLHKHFLFFYFLSHFITCLLK